MSAPTRLLAVAAVVWRDDGRTLIIQRAPGISAPGIWGPVTGKLLPNEPLAEAARREVFEECGLDVVIGDQVYRCPSLLAVVRFDIVWFDAVLTGSDRLRLDPSEVAAARWVDQAGALAATPMFADTRAFYATPGRFTRD